MRAIRLTRSGLSRVLLPCLIWIVMGAALSLAQQGEAGPLYALPGTTVRSAASSSLALAADGVTIIAVNMLNDTVSIANPTQGLLIAELPVGDDPRSVALTPNNQRAVIANRGGSSLTVVDFPERVVIGDIALPGSPYAVVSQSDDVVFVSLPEASLVVQVDLNTGAILNRIPTAADPTGLLLWDDFLYVTHFWTGDLSLIYLPQMAVVRTVATGQDTALSQSITLNPVTGQVYLPQSRSNAHNTVPTYDSMILPVINVVDLSDLSLVRESRVNLDTADQPVNMPFAAELDRVRDRLYVVNAGSDSVSVIDAATGLAIANVRVGINPRGLVLNRDGTRVYVHNAIYGTLAVIDTRTFTIIEIIPITDATAVSADVLIGAQLFHNASDSRLSAGGWLSCASCHFDGQSDGRIWQMPYGERNTPLLYDLLATAPYNWTGDWDELADVELKIRSFLAGEGLLDGEAFAAQGQPHTGLSLDLDTLTAYLLTLNGPAPNPPDDPVLVERGADVFAELGCASCHAGRAFTDGARYDVGTGGTFDTPSLRWLAESAPYFHDGRAATLREVFLLPGDHQLAGNVDPDDIEALSAYLLSLPLPDGDDGAS
jgi:YVTN family beta-propeller protein